MMMVVVVVVVIDDDGGGDHDDDSDDVVVVIVMMIVMMMRMVVPITTTLNTRWRTRRRVSSMISYSRLTFTFALKSVTPQSVTPYARRISRVTPREPMAKSMRMKPWSDTRLGAPKTLGTRTSRQWNFMTCRTGCWEGKCLFMATHKASDRKWHLAKCSTIWPWARSAVCTVSLAIVQSSPSSGVKTGEPGNQTTSSSSSLLVCHIYRLALLK